MPKHKRGTQVFAALASGALLLSGCGNGDDATEPAPHVAPTTHTCCSTPIDDSDKLAADLTNLFTVAGAVYVGQWFRAGPEG